MGRLNESTKGNSNILYLEPGSKKRVRLLFDGAAKRADGTLVTGEQKPLGSWWHRIKEDPSKGRQFHNWLCIGKFRFCPLCLENGTWEGTQPPGTKIANGAKPWPITKRTYVNTWSYDEQRVKVVVLGNNLWDKLQTIEKTVGQDIDKMDVTLTRDGMGLTTTYDAVPMGVSPFVLPEGQHLFDLEEQVAISDRPKEDLDEVLSGEYDRKFAPGARQAGPSGAVGVDTSAAMATIVHFGQYAGKSLLEIGKVDLRYLQWLAVNSNDPNISQAAASVVQAMVPTPAGVNNLPGSGTVSPGQPPVAQGPAPVPAPPVASLPIPAPTSGIPVAGPNPFAALAPPPPPPPPPPAAPPAGPKTINQLKAECISKAQSNPEYRDMTKLAAKMKQAAGHTDINTFSLPQLQMLASIL